MHRSTPDHAINIHEIPNVVYRSCHETHELAPEYLIINHEIPTVDAFHETQVLNDRSRDPDGIIEELHKTREMLSPLVQPSHPSASLCLTNFLVLYFVADVYSYALLGLRLGICADVSVSRTK